MCLNVWFLPFCICSVKVLACLRRNRGGSKGTGTLNSAKSDDIDNKKVDIDIDGDSKPDLQIDLKTIVMAVGGIISLVMTYTTLKEDIKINAIEIEIAKKLPPLESHELMDQKLIYLEDMLKKIDEDHDKRLDKIEDKIYRR